MFWIILWVFYISNVSSVAQRFPCFINAFTESVENRETKSQWKVEKQNNPVFKWQPKTRTKQIQLNTWESSQTGVWLGGCLMTVKMALSIPKKQHAKVLWKSIVLTLQTIRLINVTKGLKPSQINIIDMSWTWNWIINCLTVSLWPMQSHVCYFCVDPLQMIEYNLSSMTVVVVDHFSQF